MEYLDELEGRALHKPAEDEQLFAAWQIFKHANEGILITDRKGVIQTTNPAVGKLFGYLPDELNGKSVEILIPGDSSHKHEKLRDGYFENPYSRPMKKGEELFGVRKDGTRVPLEISLSSFKTQDGLFAIAFIADRTELSRKQELLHLNQIQLENLAKQLKIANTDLENRVKRRTQMLEETISELNDAQEQLRLSLEKEKELGDLKSKFASLVSHEFRTPLATILSSLNLIERYSREGLNDNQKNHAARIKKSVQNMVDIINDLLTITRIERNQLEIRPEPLELFGFLSNIRSDLQKYLKTGQFIEIEEHCSGEVVTDINMLGQIITNLLTNAIKFSGEHSRVQVSCRSEGNMVVVAVSDQGIGIPEEELNQLYDSFYRASNAANIEGTGLGLFIVHKCVETLKGTVDVRSSLGEGTTVTISIPRNINEQKEDTSH